ncbi:aspartic peptidase domain-containing protein [Russula dissimulans]|nr:aspartic peptidase domain-containing protein [Russula dissimulans]
MHSLWLAVFVSSLLHVSAPIAALRLGLRGVSIPRLHKRAHIAGLDDAQNLKYFTNITLGESLCSVSIDTGSSDFWVAGNISNSKDTGVSTGVQYAIDGVSGDVRTAQLNFLDFVVPDQAYIQVQPSTTHPENQGILGLGPNVGSNVHDALKKQPQGDTVIDRIFRQDPTTPNILTVLLSRSDDPNVTYPGQITVSETVPGLQNISDQPKLTVKTVPSSRSGEQHWQVLLDPNGIIGPSGQRMALSTKVAGATNSSQLACVIDTGFSLNQVPKYVSDAIYSGIPGAQFENLTTTGPIWTLPCNYEVNVTLLFGNISFPMHPLDVSFSLLDTMGTQRCVGGVRVNSTFDPWPHRFWIQFQPITSGAGPDYDAILGMTFLRNAYLLVNYGDFVDGNTNTTRASPYLQFLSITDPASAHLDFVNTRLGGTDTTGLQIAIDTQNSTSNSRPDSSSHHQTNVILIASVVSGCVLLLFIAAGAYIAVRRRRGSRGSDFPAVDAGFSSNDYHSLQYAPPPGDDHGRHIAAGHTPMRYLDAETTHDTVVPS